MAGRPWWLRIDGVPPRTLAAIQEGEARQRRRLTRREVRAARVWVAAMVTSVIAGPLLVGLTGHFYFLSLMGPLSGLMGVNIRTPVGHRRQILGLKTKADELQSGHGGSSV
jgi:hypothetical protein